MNTTWKTYRVRVTKKKTGEVFEGIMQDDGLMSLYTVTLNDGTDRYASVLDTIEYLEQFTNVR